MIYPYFLFKKEFFTMNRRDAVKRLFFFSSGAGALLGFAPLVAASNTKENAAPRSTPCGPPTPQNKPLTSICGAYKDENRNGICDLYEQGKCNGGCRKPVD